MAVYIGFGPPFSRALFESVSGWTTTGLSVVDVTSAGPMILFWRSIIQLAGGAGLAIIMMSAIVGPTGVGISSAEGRSDQLVPHVRQSARLVLIIYTCYALPEPLAYRMAGMSLFDAVNHSFAAVSTGGFPRVESIGYWDSTAIEAVTLPLMLLGNLSFVTAWLCGAASCAWWPKRRGAPAGCAHSLISGRHVPPDEPGALSHSSGNQSGSQSSRQ
jgi:trk system potassium uptake protein